MPGDDELGAPAHIVLPSPSRWGDGIDSRHEALLRAHAQHVVSAAARKLRFFEEAAERLAKRTGSLITKLGSEGDNDNLNMDNGSGMGVASPARGGADRGGEGGPCQHGARG